MHMPDSVRKTSGLTRAGVGGSDKEGRESSEKVGEGVGGAE